MSRGTSAVAVIAVEIAMVQLVMKLAQCEPAPVPDLKIGKAQMRGERIKGLDMHMEQHEQGDLKAPRDG